MREAWFTLNHVPPKTSLLAVSLPSFTFAGSAATCPARFADGCADEDAGRRHVGRRCAGTEKFTCPNPRSQRRDHSGNSRRRAARMRQDRRGQVSRRSRSLAKRHGGKMHGRSESSLTVIPGGAAYTGYTSGSTGYVVQSATEMPMTLKPLRFGPSAKSGRHAKQGPHLPALPRPL